MNTRSLIFGVLAIGGALVVAVPRSAQAVTDEEFRAWQQQMQQQAQQIQDLQKAHQQDQEEIQHLKQQIGTTQQATTDTQKKVEETQKKVEETQKKVEETQQTAAAAQAAIPSGPDAKQNFMIVGDAEMQFVKTEGQHSAFLMADFAPIFLFRATDKVLFEAGFDVTLQNGTTGSHDSGSGTSVSLSFATLDYFFNDYVTVLAGDNLLPLGTYSERSAGWLNKFPDSPLPRDVLPGSGIGLQLRGAMPVGDSGQALTYAVYGVNGPSSATNTSNASDLDLAGNVGLKSDGSVANLHGSPSAGGRIGWFFPWQPHYDVELGISGQSGPWNDADSKLWSAVVLDGALHISPYFEMKGEYMNTWVETTDRGTVSPHGWWIQAGYKLAGLQLELPMINNLELVARYDKINDISATRTERETVGFVYYITNTLWFEGDYEFLNSSDSALAKNELLFQLSYGF